MDSCVIFCAGGFSALAEPVGTDDYVIGLLCSTGDPEIDDSGITCEIIGENTLGITATVENGKVILISTE